ncbi:AraC family transcriptional regulator [Ensifer sp. CCNWLW204]|uniref:AraC family transcriptional regulator n=1 Tax=unclassified Ensifer TaxID=2633371 RepID=UPI003014DF09
MQHSDLLTTHLAPLRIEAAFISSWNMRGRWAVLGPHEPCALLHYVTSGQVVIQTDGNVRFNLEAGDLALFPHGTAHRIGDSIATPASPLSSLLPARQMGGFNELSLDGDGPALAMFCAGLHYDASGVMPLYQLLPPVLVIRANDIQREPMLSHTLHGLYLEALRVRDGKNLVLLRAFELIYILAVRVAFASSTSTGALSQVLHDPRISGALLQMYTRYRDRWTVAGLANEVGMSKSAFSERFRSSVGESPARHLARIRLTEAKHLIRSTNLSLEEISSRVGYQSIVGMHLAFRSMFGETPGTLRRRKSDTSPHLGA